MSSMQKQFKRQQSSQRPVDAAKSPKQTHQFKRPPPGNTAPGGTTAHQNQNMTPTGAQANILRRVSSVQNNNQNGGSVSESLQQFMACRSNSAARSSQGALSSHEEVATVSKQLRASSYDAPFNKDQSTSPKPKRDASSSMERIDKYLQRGNEDRVGTTADNMQESQKENGAITTGKSKMIKPPRASSQNVTGKQVRFDIKEGLKDMIKESGPAFNAAQIHKQLMDKHRKQKQALTRQSADDLKLSLVSQNYSDLHSSSRREHKNTPGTKASPAFGSTVRKSTPKERKHLNQSATSSARRYQQIISPKSSSSKKHAYNLALRYQKEVLESKVRKGQIDLSRLNQSAAIAEANDNQLDQTPKSSRILPPKPTQMTNLIPEVVHQEASKTMNATLDVNDRRRRQSAASQPRSSRKAGSICRLRSESPINVGQIHNQQVKNNQDEISHQPTCEDDESAPVPASGLVENQENVSANRTFYAGQIVKLAKVTQSNQKQSEAQNHQFACSSETQSVVYQPTPIIHSGEFNSFSPVALQQPQQSSSTPGRSPNFAHQNTNDNNGGVMSSYVNTTTPISQQSFTQLNQQQNQVGIFSADESAFYQNEGTTERSHQDDQNSGYFNLANSSSDPNFQQIQFAQALFSKLWDSFVISEQEFLAMTNQFSQCVEMSKNALHEPLRQDEEAAGLSSARQAQRGVQVPKQRLHLIRVHLRFVLLDSFLPLIHEIIQLRDRLAYRKYTFRHAIKNPLKASIISDICSRLKQKIVLKVLFLKSQYRKNLHSLFQAYHDLLVNKQIVRATFDQMRTFKQRKMEKTAYLDYAKSQITELTKLQVFDAMKRFGQIERLEYEKSRQAQSILARRKTARILLSWKTLMVTKRINQISQEMIEKFRTMKNRHQLFAKWVNVHRVGKKIKAKALLLVNRQQDEKSKAVITESDFATEQSTTSLQEQADASAQLSRVNSRSEEIFYRQIQELLLEKEHHQTCLKRLVQQMKSQELDHQVPIYFDMSQNPEVWDVKPSQALLSNKEQIYSQYPELQKEPLTAIPATLCDTEATLSYQAATTQSHNALLTKSVSDLKSALQPPLHKFMVCPQPSHQTLMTQETILGTKYSVHQMLVAQQNMYGLKSTVVKKLPLNSNESIDNNQHDVSLRHELSEIADLKQHQRLNNMMLSEDKYCSESAMNSSIPFRSTVSNGQTIRALPFKKQSLFQPQLRQDAQSNERAPNQLFVKLQKQNQELMPSSQSQIKHGVSVSGKLPTEIQIQAHMRNMLMLLRENWEKNGSSRDMIRAKAMSLAMNELNPSNGDPISTPSEGMSLSDFTQVAMQAGISMLHLNDLQLKLTFTDVWREKMLINLLCQDIGELRSIQNARLALREWHKHIQRQKLRAVNHQKTKQMQQFYSLFTHWSKANRKLVYETERSVRHFKMKYVLSQWRKAHQTSGKTRVLDKAAIKFYVRSLHAKALASLFQNKRRLINCKMFERRQALLKFFKRRWLPLCRARLLLRRVLESCAERDQDQDRSRYQRQFDILKNALRTWKKRVSEKQLLYDNYMAINHYKLSLVYRHFMALKNAPTKTIAVNKLVNSLLGLAIQKPFDQMLKVCAVENLRVREFKQQRDLYIKQHFIAHLHAMAVKTKIAKLFVQRKFLKALQKHIFKNNYIRPLAFREHQLRSKALFALRNRKGDKWKRQRLDIVFRALQHRKNKNTLHKCFDGLREVCLDEKRERIIECTVLEFRTHTLIDKSFKMLKLHKMRQHKKILLNQVADEFHWERINREIEIGRTLVHVNTQTGCLLNANQDLLLKVMTEWKFISRSLRRNKYKLEHKMNTKKQMLLLKCFLGWRSVARYEQSDLSQLDQNAVGGTKSAISYLDVIDRSSEDATTVDYRDDSLNAKPLRRNNVQQRGQQQLRYHHYQGESGSKSNAAISYINTDQESAQREPVFTQERKAIVAQVASESSFVTSLIDSSQQMGQQSSLGNKMSMGQFNKGTGPQFGGTGQFLTQDNNSESTLNARAPPYQGHLKSSSHLGRQQFLHGQSSTLLSNPSSSQLNQRQFPSAYPGGPTMLNKQHQHHASMPDYTQPHQSQQESNAINVQPPSSYTPGMYQDTSEFASGPDCGKTAEEGEVANHTGSVESFQDRHFGGQVGFGHNHGVSAEEMVLSPAELLSVNDVLSKAETTQGEFTYEQLTREAVSGNAVRKGEPTLVTTLRPYNYEIDLPLKQASSSNISNAQRQHNLIKQREDYATFSIQECEQAPLDKNRRVFSSNNVNEDDDSSVQSDDQALRDARQTQNNDEMRVQMDQQKHSALQQHLGSLTLSNGTGAGNLCEELESIFRHNDELTGEQEQRDAFLRDLANHYQTQLTTKDAYNTSSIAHGSIDVNDYEKPNQQQKLDDSDSDQLLQSSQGQVDNDDDQNNTIKPYAMQSSYIESESALTDSDYQKQHIMSASFANGRHEQKDFPDQNRMEDDYANTQEDEMVSVKNPMDSRIYYN